jgi:hypothetical protein
MKKLLIVILAMIVALGAFGIQASPAYALGATDRVLVAQLTGPAIEGVVPSGKAEFAASQGSSSLTVGMFNLNLVDGTCLDIAFGRTVVQGIPVVRGGASLFFDSSVDPSLTIRSGEAITISIGVPPVGQSSCLLVLGGGVLSTTTDTVLAPAAGTVILSGTFQVATSTK